MLLNESTFLLYAAKNYENQSCCDMEEFYSDLLIPMHLKKLFTRYHSNGVLKEQLIINHIISFFNVFNANAAVAILFYKLDKEYYSYLKTFLVYLGRCPTFIIGININNIELDQNIIKYLEKQETRSYK